MELWVRSQDKERLCKVNNLFIKNFSICCSCNDENNDYDYLGVYSTKERALEVLDEIQDLMISLSNSDLKIIQYKMPKE